MKNAQEDAGEYLQEERGKYIMNKKIISVSIVKNESDIIESFIRYHLNIVDGMVILDHGSTDGTREILIALIEEGLPVYLFNDFSMEYTQADKTNQLIDIVINQLNPDIIIPLDADEFLASHKKQTNPRNFLEAVEDGIVYRQRSYPYLFFPDDDPLEKNILKRITKRGEAGSDHVGKVFATTNTIKEYGLQVDMGNHNLLKENGFIHTLKEEIMANNFLAHFQYRSVEQIKSKIFVGLLKVRSDCNSTKELDLHWQDLFFKLQKEENIYDVLKIKIDQYHLCPLDLSFQNNWSVKYTHAEAVDYFHNVLNYSLVLAEHYARTKRELAIANRINQKYLVQSLWEIVHGHNVLFNIDMIKYYKSKTIENHIEKMNISLTEKENLKLLLHCITFRE